MDNIINNLKADPLSNVDIISLCDDKTNVVKYSELINYDNIDDLLQPFDNVVILYETGKNYGHWVCLIKYGNTIEFFDPYGLGVDEQLSFSKKSLPLLSILLLNSDYKLIENKTQLQKKYNNVSSCGRHVAVRLILKQLDIYEYLKMFENNKYDPDTVVTYLTSFIN